MLVQYGIHVSSRKQPPPVHVGNHLDFKFWWWLTGGLTICQVNNYRQTNIMQLPTCVKHVGGCIDKPIWLHDKPRCFWGKQLLICSNKKKTKKKQPPLLGGQLSKS